MYFGINEDWLRDAEHRERLAAWILGVGDATILTSLDYPYVQSWIDALGPTTDIHEEFKPAKQGELLPTRAEHEATTRPVDGVTSLVGSKVHARRYSPTTPIGELAHDVDVTGVTARPTQTPGLRGEA